MTHENDNAYFSAKSNPDAFLNKKNKIDLK
jgi:hypothetical protein